MHHTIQQLKRVVRRALRLSADDSAQAMTEFVIVIPAVLLACFAALQTVVIGETVQYCNYAAFAAARSYATGYAKYQRDGATNPHYEATCRARCVAAMALAPISHGQNYLYTFGGTPYSRGEFTTVMYGARQSGNSLEALKQQILEGFSVAFAYRIEGFRITRTAGPDDEDIRGTVDCQFTYRLPLAIPGLMSVWNYFHQDQSRRNIANLTKLDDVAGFGDNRPHRDDGVLPGPHPGGEEFPTDGMKAHWDQVLQNWHSTPTNPNDFGLASQYSDFILKTGRTVPANVRIGAYARVGFEPLIGDMP